jgi:HAD superfamily PSPase-like hydrolase
MTGQDRVKLVAFDMEGCLTADPTVWEIMHRKLGTWESHGLPYWNRYRAGELEYDEFARMDVAVWRGAPADLLAAAASEVPLMRGCAELLGALSAAGIRAAVITNGLACVADRFRDAFGIEHTYANRVLVEGRRLTGGLEICVPYARKGHVLRRLARQLGLRREELAAVGDSPSDIAMLRAVRVAVAVQPCAPEVATAATHVLQDGDLRSLVPVFMPGGASPSGADQSM